MTTWVNDPSQLVLANGTVATSGNTGGAAGDAFTPATSTGGSVLFQDGTWEHIGNAGVARLDWAIPSAAIYATEYLVDLAAMPTVAENRLIEIRNSGGPLARITQITTGEIRAFDAANVSLWTSTATYSGPTRIFLAVQPGASTSTGKVRLNVYTGTSTTVADSYTSDAVNLGTTPVAAARYGRVNSDAGSTATVRTVNVQAKDTDLTPIGPLIAALSNLPTFRYSADGSTLAANGATLMYSPDGTTLEPLDVA